MANSIQKKPPRGRSKLVIKKPPVLFKRTQAVVASLEEKVGGTFISYWVSANSRIVGEDAAAMFDLIRMVDTSKPLFLFLKSDGGSGIAALRLVHLLREHFGRITVLAPLDCASAATMLALGADSIHMGPVAYLSAVDTSITHDLSPVDKDGDLVSVSQDELQRVLKLWKRRATGKDASPYPELYKQIHPLVFGAVDRASSLSIRVTTEILSYHMKDTDKAAKISQHLNSAYPAHGYPITFREASRLGLKVERLRGDWNDDLIQLSRAYSEMAQLAYTDYDELNYHDNEILKIFETRGTQLLYQKDKDWHYRVEERRWVPMNDESSWRRLNVRGGKVGESRFYLR